MVFYYTMVADTGGWHRNRVGKISWEQTWLGDTADLPVPGLCHYDGASQRIPADVVFRRAESSLSWRETTRHSGGHQLRPLE